MRKKVLAVEELAELLASSLPTARRRLKEWHTHTSYNHNGRYYVLPEVAQFDPNGLWRYRSIFFSRHGTLKATVIHLINDSPAGLTAAEIKLLVGLEPRSFLSHFRDEPQLQRQKIEGRFVYLSSDQETRAKQKQKRKEQAARAALIRSPTDAEGIVILVERIKQPETSIEDLSKRLRKRGLKFRIEELRNFLECHGLLKKTPNTAR
jgi:hypothetical protein